MFAVAAATCLAVSSPNALLAANREANPAPNSGTLVRTYRYRSEGMVGIASSTIDFASGRYVETDQAGLSRGGAGFDGTTPWMRDLSNFNIPQNGGNKPALAINKAYRNANLWWRGDHGGAAIKPIECNSIEVTPRGGLPFRATFDSATHLLASVNEQQSFGQATDTRYSDYRRCGPTLVPGRIEVINDGDSSSSGTFELEKCAVAPPRPRSAYTMPPAHPRDWALPPSGRATIAMRPHDTEVMIKVRINGKGPFLFYLDSGGHDLLSPRVAHELGIKIEGTGRSGGAGESTVETGYAKVASLDAGGAMLTNQTVLILETSPPDVVGEKIGGLIGLEFFERFVTHIDYAANKVTFEDPRRFTAAERRAAGTAVPFKFYEHMPQVTGRFDGLPAAYNIDTGSSQTVTMTRPFVEAAQLRTRYPDAVTMVDGFGTGGPTRSTIVRARSLALGSEEIARPAASLSTAQRGAFSDPFYAGNVGNGALRHFAVTFDYPRSTMYLARVEHPDLSAYGYNRTGIIVVLDHGRLKVVDASPGTPAAEAGIMVGDILSSVGGMAVARQTLRETKQMLKQVAVGRPLPVDFFRDGTQHRVLLIPRNLVPN
jgi:hypothetical protein